MRWSRRDDGVQVSIGPDLDWAPRAGRAAHVIEAIAAGRGRFYLDPHGAKITKLLDDNPPRTRPDVIWSSPGFVDS